MGAPKPRAARRGRRSGGDRVLPHLSGKNAKQQNKPQIFSFEMSHLRGQVTPSAILLDHVTGGWETEPIDDAQLPADFVLDYVRVWQRSDLATLT